MNSPVRRTLYPGWATPEIWLMEANQKSDMQSKIFTDKKHLFFDLDHTLWDFDRNAEETLSELFDIYRFRDLGFSSADVFIESYTRNNQLLWAQYHLGEIDKNHLRKADRKSTRLNSSHVKISYAVFCLKKKKKKHKV